MSVYLPAQAPCPAPNFLSYKKKGLSGCLQERERVFYLTEIPGAT